MNVAGRVIGYVDVPSPKVAQVPESSNKRVI